MRGVMTCAAAVLALVGGTAQAQDAAPDRALWGDLATLAGKTWIGTPPQDSSERMRDIGRFEWAMGGAVLRRVHATREGAYGGETLIYWDRADRRLEYVYITNSNFRTEGFFTVNADGSWASEEDVTGAGDVTKVRAIGRMTGPDRYEQKVEYLKAGAWVSGHSFNYVLAPAGTEVVIKPRPAKP